MSVIEGQDIFVDDFSREERILQLSEVPSNIQTFFNGSTIFITGATGFFGKVLIEKILRVCWRVKKVYLLMRPKKGKSIEERFQEQFEGPLFDLMKKKKPEFLEKVAIIPGDLAKDGSILSDEHRQLLIDTVDVIFHCAATVRFDEKIRQAVNINVKATKYFLDLAREMKNLKAFIHVSTAYSNCPIKAIGEKFYPPPYNYKNITGILEYLDDNLLEAITPKLIDKWPNTYTFTKTIGEDVVREFGKGLPIGILRPSIVISTYKEPITGWINNYYGPQGVVFGAGLGLIRTLHCDPNVIADMVPIDLVVNALLALAWDIAQTKGDNPNFERLSWREASFDDNSNVEKEDASDEIPILNYVSSEKNPITWGTFMKYNYDVGYDTYSVLMLWHSSISLNSNFYVHLLLRYLCHYFPALIVDFIAILIRKKPQILKAYKKIHKFTDVIAYFSTTQWKFEDENVAKLWNKLSERDKQIFNFNVKDLDWEQYFSWYLKGVRVYLAKDEMSTLPEGRKRAVKLKIIHYSVIAILNLILFYVLWCIFSPLFF